MPGLTALEPQEVLPEKNFEIIAKIYLNDKSGDWTAKQFCRIDEWRPEGLLRLFRKDSCVLNRSPAICGFSNSWV